MPLRINETPWGGSRFAYAYLGTVLASVGGILVALIGYAIAGAVPQCSASLYYCVPAWTGLVGAVALFACLFVVAHIIRLGWRWAAWFIACTLVLGEIIIETSWVGLALIMLVIPALAAAISFERPDHELSRWVRLTHLIVLVVIGVQFVVWAIILAVS